MNAMSSRSRLSPSSASPSQPPNAIRLPKTAEVIANQIRKRVIRGELQPGDFLPPEAQVVEELATSRPTIREAYRILEAERFISVKRGARSGARVHLPTSEMVARYAGYVLQSQGTTLGDLYLARVAVEPFVAKMLAEQSDQAVVAKLKQAIDRVEAQLDAGHIHDFRLEAMRFHLLMVELCGNRTLALIFLMLEQVFEAHQFRYEAPPSAKHTEKATEKRNRLFLRSCRKMIALIEAGDGEAAAQHWKSHIENVNKLWLDGFAATSLVDVLE